MKKKAVKAPQKKNANLTAPRVGGLKKKTKNIEEKESDLNSDELEENDNVNFLGNKPSAQQLPEHVLNETLPAKMLNPINPQAPKNLTIYSFKERKYILEELLDQQAVHFVWDGNEAKIQEEIQESRDMMINEAIRLQESEVGTKISREGEDLLAIKKTLRNKFNYNERQAQTLNNIIREKGISTEPPPSYNKSGSITQWEIFDSFDKQKKPETVTEEATTDSYYKNSFKKCLKIMERMIVNNEEAVKYYDYKYFWSQNEAVEATKNEESMYPLWRFGQEKQRKKHVTSICWNPRYNDLFAVGLGSYEFKKLKPGLIWIFSIKNTKFPEYTFAPEFGVMTLDFHPKSPALLAVGLHDGTVLVYDIRNKHKKPIYQSTIRTMKHTDPVWQVYWNPDISKKYNFYSISSDGRVMNWILMKNKLEPEEIIRLKLTGKNSDEETSLIGLACGLCFDFNKFEPHKFLVGTEEGYVHLCSRAYSGQYLETYKGHLLAIYKVRWNPFHSRTFITASADWTVKIWDSKINTAISSFELGMAVVDAVWAPYSSTIFSTAILDKVYVFDLSKDKHTRQAEGKPARNPKLTNLAFNAKDPLLLCGDTSSGVTLLKLPPSLTRKSVIPPENEGMTFDEYEYNKMEDFLSVVGKFQRDEV